jgi:Uma2 family endonuclease
MVPPATATPSFVALPDHKQLPETDGSIVENFQEHPQGNLLTECLLPRLRELYPDGQFAIGHDSGIYWRVTEPPLDGCKAPDWFLVPGVPPMLDGEFRRSYVLWQEIIKPLVVVEFVSGDGSEERDTTPYKGKFWVYEKAICAGYYVIFEGEKPSVEVYRLVGGQYAAVAANAAGRFPIEPLGVELGIWHGAYRGMDLPWLRVWDSARGEMLTLGEERADLAEGLLDDARRRLEEETERAETERKRAEDEKRRAEDEKRRAEDEKRRAEDEKRRAEDEKRRADEAKLLLDKAVQDREKLLEKLRAAGIDPGI